VNYFLLSRDTGERLKVDAWYDENNNFTTPENAVRVVGTRTDGSHWEMELDDPDQMFVMIDETESISIH
jgi:hypothetical protein